VYSLQFHEFGSRLLAKVGQSVHVYDIVSEALLFQCPSHSAACYNFDATCIYGGDRGGTMAIWDAETGSRIYLTCGAYVAPSPDRYGKLLVPPALVVVLM
jgi:hypothetical protein